MVEKMIIDSVFHWAKNYRVDGFRFDLMAFSPKEQLLKIKKKLSVLTLESDGVDGKNILLYGEGWNFGEVADNKLFYQASQGQMNKSGIAVFDDKIRESVKEFVSGKRARIFEKGLIASWASEPYDAISYVDAHDDMTLYDNLLVLAPDLDIDERIRANALALGIISIIQTATFWHAGVDILRSKGKHENSFNAGDEINKINWKLDANSKKSFLLSRQMLELKYSSPLFRLKSRKEIDKKLFLYNLNADGVEAFSIFDNKEHGKAVDKNANSLLVVINANREKKQIKLPELKNKKYELIDLQKNGADEIVKSSIWDSKKAEAEIPPLSLAVFIEKS
jgi:pullulanase/glycogen debranching enzyme